MKSFFCILFFATLASGHCVIESVSMEDTQTIVVATPSDFFGFAKSTIWVRYFDTVLQTEKTCRIFFETESQFHLDRAVYNSNLNKGLECQDICHEGITNAVGSCLIQEVIPVDSLEPMTMPLTNYMSVYYKTPRARYWVRTRVLDRRDGLRKSCEQFTNSASAYQNMNVGYSELVTLGSPVNCKWACHYGQTERYDCIVPTPTEGESQNPPRMRLVTEIEIDSVFNGAMWRYQIFYQNGNEISSIEGSNPSIWNYRPWEDNDADMECVLEQVGSYDDLYVKTNGFKKNAPYAEFLSNFAFIEDGEYERYRHVPNFTC